MTTNEPRFIGGPTVMTIEEEKFIIELGGA